MWVRSLSKNRPFDIGLCSQWNAALPEFVCLDTFEGGTIRVTHQSDANSPGGKSPPPPPVQQKPPERELELKLKKNPQDLDSKADVGSDQSMDASDPSAATQPGGNEPVPSSTFPEKE